MSYILDALKKAEQERDLGRVPRLGTVHGNVPRRAPTLLWLIAGIVLMNAAALIWWLRPGMQPDVPTTVRQVPLSAAPPPRIAQLASAVPAPPPIKRVPAPKIIAPPVAMTSIDPAPARTPVTTPVAPAASAPVVVKPDTANVPLLRDLPADLRAVVPPMSLDVHVYAASATGRFVLINMRKYHEGDQLGEGPRIAEITEEGVVLSYQGQLFRIARP